MVLPAIALPSSVLTSLCASLDSSSNVGRSYRPTGASTTESGLRFLRCLARFAAERRPPRFPFEMFPRLGI